MLLFAYGQWIPEPLGVTLTLSVPAPLSMSPPARRTLTALCFSSLYIGNLKVSREEVKLWWEESSPGK